MEKINSNWIKVYIIDILPGLAVALYILGFFYTGFFYSAFGINIEHYISLSEMLLDIIFPLIIIVFFYLLILIMIYYLLYEDSLPYFSKKLDESIQKYKEKEGDKSELYKLFSKRNNRLLKGLFISTISVLVFFIGVNELIHDENKVPALISPLLLNFIILSFFVPIFILSTPRPQRSVMILESVLVYYIFAAIIFGYCGYKEGLYVKNHDITRFEIKTNDGKIFDNLFYRYLNQINDRVFLLEKESQNNVILGKENILYMKIKPIKPINDKNDEEKK